MLVAFPPTSARFLSGCPKPEAFTTIATSTIDQVLSARASRCAQAALSDREGPDVSAHLLQIDDGFEAMIFALAARDLMSARGFDRGAGADDEIVRLGEEARKDLDAMMPLKDGGKRITPHYVMDAARARQDSVRVRSRVAADDWARSTSDPRSTRRVG